MSAELPLVSVVMPCRDEAPYLEATFDGLDELDYPRDRLEIILVDNDSTDGSPEIARRRGACVVSAPGVHAGGVRNAGARRARGDVLAFLDSDCTPAPDWLQRALVHLADPGVGATGGHSRVPDDATWVERTVDFHATVPGVHEVQFLPTANMLLRREAFESVGGFTEDLRTGEDSDFSDRLRERGLRLVSDTAVRVVHQAWPKTIPELFRREMWLSSGMLRLFRASGHQPRYLFGMLAAAGYAVALLGALGCLTAAVARGQPAWLLAAALLALSAPGLAASVKALRKGRFDFLHLSTPYYAIILLGRIAAGLRAVWPRRDDRARW